MNHKYYLQNEHDCHVFIQKLNELSLSAQACFVAAHLDEIALISSLVLIMKKEYIDEPSIQEFLKQAYLLLPGVHRIYIAKIHLTLFISQSDVNVKTKPWLKKAPALKLDMSTPIAIVGAGIAGASTAYALAMRGFKVVVYDKNISPAMEASGNYQGMLYGNFSAHMNDMMELSIGAYRYASYLFKNILKESKEFANCGIIQLAHTDKESLKQQQLVQSQLYNELCFATNKEKIKQIIDVKIHNEKSGVFYPYGMWLSPKHLVMALLNHPNIKLCMCHEIINVTKSNAYWVLVDSQNNKFNHQQVVFCNAHAVNKLELFKNLNLRKIRGQVSVVSGENNFKSVICGDKYIAPSFNNKFTVGASFDFKTPEAGVKLSDDIENLKFLNELLPNYDVTNKLFESNANIRCSSHDYMPVVGPIAEYDKFMVDFAKLSKDKNYRITNECKYLDGIYLNIAHGAKGLMSAPLCGEIIADYIQDVDIACSEQVRQALHPNRIYANCLIKTKQK